MLAREHRNELVPDLRRLRDAVRMVALMDGRRRVEFAALALRAAHGITTS